MNGDLKIFIAGAKKLKEERIGLQSLANNLTLKYIKEGIHVIAGSYEQFEDDQKAYNDFIENSADIVIFIIDGKLGRMTEEEFLIAAHTYSKEQHPEVMVFLREFDKNNVTPEIMKVEQLIKEKFGTKYYVDYSDLDDLKSKVEERIVRYIDKHEKEIKNKGRKKPWYKRVHIGVICLALMFAVVLTWMYNSYKEPILVFAGGGSVKNYLYNTCDSLDVRDYPHSINIPVASGSSWGILFEEYHRKLEGQNLEFVTVCLSAGKILDTLLKENGNALKDKSAKVVEVFLGYDSLRVYIGNKVRDDNNLTDSITISTDLLASLIQNNNYMLYTTSTTSGTLKSYLDCLPNIDFADKWEKQMIKVFYEGTDAQDMGDSYILLGSSNYYNKYNKYDKSLYVRGSDGKCILKSLYLYFMVYRDKSPNTNIYTANEQIVGFLKKVVFPDKYKVSKNPSNNTKNWNILIEQGYIDFSDAVSVCEVDEIPIKIILSKSDEDRASKR